MKLGVCGDSFMASIGYNENDLDNGYNNHFTEILGRKIGWDVVTFARGACGNQTIRLQIDEIIKENPDVVIIGTTSPDRIEFPLNDLNVDDYYDKFIFNERGFIQHNGLYNIDYSGYPEVSATHKNFSEIKPKLSSETLNNVFWNKHNTNLNQKEQKILEEWYNRFFDFQWKTQQDTWIIANGLRKLMDNNISFFCINVFLYKDELSYFGDRIINNESDLNPWRYYDHNDKNVKYRFHTTLKKQEILAEKWHNFFIEKNII